MKKIISILIVFLTFSANVSAYDFMVDGLCYNINYEGNSVTVTNESENHIHYENLNGEIIIPENVEHNGKSYLVTAIDYDAFAGCTGLTSVEIPESVTEIGDCAFSGCTGLTSVAIPENVTVIGSSVFWYCTGLTSATIPESVTAIGPQAFMGCTGLSSVTIPESVTEIGSYAFWGCTGLTSATIPENVTVIGTCAFEGCTGLTLLKIPNSVTEINSEAFSGCSSLTSIKVEEGNKRYDSRNNCNAIIETSTNKLILGCKNTKIPNYVKEIGQNAFEGCTGLTSIRIPNSVTEIGESAFKDCIDLTSVKISDNVTQIGSSAFFNCIALTKVIMPNSVTEIGESAFEGCTSLASIRIPNSVTKICPYTFRGCTSMTSIDIPKSVTMLGDKAFEGCTGLISVEIPDSVTLIIRTFANCTGLTSVKIPNSLTMIYAPFTGCSCLNSIYSMIREPQNVTYGYEDKRIHNSNGWRIDYTSIFSNVDKDNCTVYVPMNTSDSYKNTCPWYDFANIEEYNYGNIYGDNSNNQETIVFSQNLDSLKQQFRQYYDNIDNDKVKAIEIGKRMLQYPGFLTDKANYNLIDTLADFFWYKSKEEEHAIDCFEAYIEMSNKKYMTHKTRYNFACMHEYVGDWYYKKKEYDKAKDYYKNTINIYEDTITMYSDVYSTYPYQYKIYIPDLYIKIGKCCYENENKEYAEAKESFDKAINTSKSITRSNPVYYQYQIGVFYYNNGDYDTATNYFDAVLNNKDTEEEDYIDILDIHNKNGYYHVFKKEYDEAIISFERALETYNYIIENRLRLPFGIHLRDDADIELQEAIGFCQYKNKEYDEAIKSYEKVIELLNKKKSHHYKIALMYDNIGICYYTNKNIDSALINYRNAWSICEDYYNYETEFKYFKDCAHDVSKQLCKDISICGLYPNYYESFYDYCKETLDYEYNETLSVFDNSDEKKKRSDYWERQSNLFQDVYPAITFEIYKQKENSLNDNDNSIIGDLYNKSAIFAKGLLLTSENEWHRIIFDSGNENLKQQLRKLLETNDTTLEKVLFQFAQERGDFMKPLKLTWDSIKAKLDTNDIAIEFLSFPILGADRKQYIALTVRNIDGYDQPHLIELCEESELLEAAKQPYTSKALSDLIWGKLAEKGELDDKVKNIYFSPCGELHNIAIESMPHWSKQGVMMNDSIEGFNIYRLSSTRELAIEHTSVSFNSAAIFGDIDYNATVEDMVSHSHHSEGPSNDNNDNVAYILPSQEALIQIDNQDLAQNESSGRSYRIITNSDGTRGINWNYLKNTKDEVQEINSTLENNGFEVYYKTDLDATETSFKNLKGQKRRIIHIATHGFYWNDSIALQEIKETNPTFMRNYENLHNASDKAMVCAGLAFLGANNALSNKDTIPTNIDDGVLTAQEVSQLDLRGLELLVLSACQTGLGEIGGDGVFGLQRGFKKAGAQTIVMSLWEVDDQATKDMMTSFYTHLMEMGMDHKREAFLKAQQEVRNNDYRKNKYSYSYTDNDNNEVVCTYKDNPQKFEELRNTRPHWAAFIMLDGQDK